MTEKKLFLLDAYALIFRAYYALIRMPRVNSKGFNTSAIFGFVNTLEELLRKENPSHIAVCFDPPGPTFRHEAFEAYKGEREATPEDIRLAIPYIKSIIEAYRIPILEVEGFEADDVIGTMAHMAADEGFTTFMMTPDKDFAQLVTDRILQYKPSYRGQDFEIRGVREVCERYGISSPLQVIDLLALMGDKIDNIPGCPGVGEKTAVRLIDDFGSVDNLIAHTDALKGALRKKVEENTEQILFSKYLATIRTDVPLERTPDSLVRREADVPALTAIFDDLEFRQLKERVLKRLNRDVTPRQQTLFDDLGDDVPSADTSAAAPDSEALPQADITSEAHEYLNVADEAMFTGLLAALGGASVVGLATIAPGPSDMSAPLIGVAVAVEPGKAFYIHRPSPQKAFTLMEALSRSGLLVVSPDIKRDFVALRNVAVDHSPLADNLPPSGYFDTGLAHYLLQPDLRHGLDLLAETYLHYRMLSIADIAVGKGSEVQRLEALPSDAATGFGCERADIALRLHSPLLAEIDKAGMRSLLDDMELPLALVLARMEITGVRVDAAALDAAAAELNSRIGTLAKEIHELAGVEFNISSPARVGEILFDHLHLDEKAKKTKSGQYSTSEEVLEKIAHLHPIVEKILKYRRLRKLVNTYLTALPGDIDPRTGRIHTTYNQTITATGRISSSDPNLQNIPVRQGDGREIRRAFTADPGHLFLSADYSQIELRLAADFADDPVMLEAFRNGTDIHTVTAARIYHCSIDDVTPDRRRKAKTANFGILYGISAFGLANRLNIPRAEAKELIDNYFATFPTIHRYMEESIERARGDGYVTTIHGRRRMLPDINSRNPVVRGYAERNAINAPIQGSAADIIKIAMVNIDREMRKRGLKSRMIMQVHDELNFDVPPAELPLMQELVERLMREAYSGKVPLTAEAGVGGDWLTAH